MKKLMTRMVTAMAVMIGSTVLAATVTVDEVKRQYPWDGKIYVTYTASDVEPGSCYAAESRIEAEDWVSASFMTNLTSNGTFCHAFDAEAEQFADRDVEAKVIFHIAEPNFAIVDLSAGPETNAYPVSYLYEMSDQTNDSYRTDRLLLKRVTTGGVTNYVGVFEVTQRQYERVTGETPSYFTNLVDGAAIEQKRPVERVSYESLTKTGGFFDRLTERTGLKLALPSVEQWAAAARGNMPAGTSFNLGEGVYTNLTGKVKIDNAWLPRLGRYVDRWLNGKVTANGNANANQASDATLGTAIVGSYGANDNGLYDMHGNVAEWTSELDGQDHNVLCGGDWKSAAADCSVDAARVYLGGDLNALNVAGFRIFSEQVEPDGFVHETTVTSEWVIPAKWKSQWTDPATMTNETAEARVYAALKKDGFSDAVARHLSVTNAFGETSTYHAFTNWASASVQGQEVSPADLCTKTNVLLGAAFFLDPTDFQSPTATVTVIALESELLEGGLTRLRLKLQVAGDFTIGIDADENLFVAAIGLLGSPEVAGPYLDSPEAFTYQVTESDTQEHTATVEVDPMKVDDEDPAPNRFFYQPTTY